MEELDETAFAVLLSFLTPEDACSLGCVSTTFQAWVEASPLWKIWCEQACPSIKLPPVREIVNAHYGSQSADGTGRTYKQLYFELERGPISRQDGAHLLDSNEPEDAQCFVDLASLEDLPNLVLLMDVRAGDELLVSLCAGGCDGHFEPIASADFLKPEFDTAKTKGKLRTVFERCVMQFDAAFQSVQLRAEEGAGTAKLVEAMRPFLSFSWRLMSNKDGRVRMVLKREVSFRIQSKRSSGASPWAEIGCYVVKERHVGKYLFNGRPVRHHDRLSLDTISERNMRILCFEIFEMADKKGESLRDWYQAGSAKYEVQIGFVIGTASYPT
eukprot:TRINITY_DN17350_c0_g1_i1.p1 TRINITY_DN17350_c0_g1~~TRINITY_DN17350_c0_g1_i1.p1  ORF type:complete len:328 (-),score=31.44 TRINITY_DN17350_c0_g1_i1:334-1317(-)